MSEKLEKQWLVSRSLAIFLGGPSMQPWLWFDSRSEARAFIKAKEAASKRYLYGLDPIHRGPKA